MVPAPHFRKDVDRTERPVKENARSREQSVKDSLKGWELFNLEIRRQLEIFIYKKDNWGEWEEGK